MVLVFLHYNEIGFVFRGDARQVLLVLLAARSLMRAASATTRISHDNSVVGSVILRGHMAEI
jgi:phosphate uptake regulator